MRQRRYRVVSNHDLGLLESEVNRILDNGGELVGGITCVRDAGDILWCQAVMCWY